MSDLYVNNRIKRVRKDWRKRRRGAILEDWISLVYCLICIGVGVISSGAGAAFLIAFGIYGVIATIGTWGKAISQKKYKREKNDLERIKNKN